MTSPQTIMAARFRQVFYETTNTPLV